jgi:hypothetical protein
VPRIPAPPVTRLLLLVLPLVLAACGGKPVWAPDEALARAAHATGQPPSITLVTVVNNDTDEGEHAALIIDGSQRVIFDPAGSWHHPRAPERNDLVFGISEAVLAHYYDYHARRSHRVELQRIAVTREVADRAISLAQAAGPVSPSFCGDAVARVLRDTPGFASLPQTLWPRRLAAGFARLPGVASEIITDDDDPFNRDLLDALPPA